MSYDYIDSSDSVRSPGRLKHAQTVTFDQPLELTEGGQLSSVTVVYETYGRLNAAKDNAVLICHAISGDSHVTRHDDSDDPGWWDAAEAVGPARPIDTDKLFVICPNILGSCRGTTGPSSINPQTGKPYGPDFPTVTVADMVKVQRRLIDYLGIEKLLAVVGGSLGGHQALTWGYKYPDRTAGVITLATSPRVTSQALAFDVVARNAILRDPKFHGGHYYDKPQGPSVGLALARMIGHITYLSREAMRDKFEDDRHEPRDVTTKFEKRFSVGSYLGHQGDRFVERFDANSYLTLTLAMDLFDLGDSRQELIKALEPAKAKWLIISFASDWLFPADQSREIVDALVAVGKPVSYCDVASTGGHDAFLLPDELSSYGELTKAFLANLSGDQQAISAATFSNGCQTNPMSIFHPEHPARLDFHTIVGLIPAAASVLDLGCGNGGLLVELIEHGHDNIVGIELDEHAVLSCVSQGLNVIQSDLNQGLASFTDGQFDCVVLSQTLQTVRDVERLINEMLRVGDQCIVSFPNFAYHKLRKMLYEQGRAPESGGLLHHKWYNSPNIRFLSIADFEDFCREKKIKVHTRIALDTEEGCEVTDEANLNADMAIFVLSR